MRTSTAIHIRAPVDTVFRLAAETENWARSLPHYRQVQILGQRGPRSRTLSMAARRDFIPVAWVSEQELEPEQGRIRFHHIGGVTRGMRVEWRLRALPDGTYVEIVHEFSPPWPVPDLLVHWIVGRFFVDAIAGRTLKVIKRLAEAQAGCAAGAR